MMSSSIMEDININEEERSSSNSIFPRSLQWCVRLGLLSSNSSTTNEEQQQRRLQEMHQNYQNLVELYPFPDEGQDDVDGPNDEMQNPNVISATLSGDSTASNVDLDPLTAMVMEQQSREEHLQQMDLKYRKEKAMRNRGKGGASERIVAEDDDNDPRVERQVTLEVIDKDLARLPPPPPPSSSSSSASTTEESISKRKAILRRVLYCFHCHTHPTPGYRQGMHEIASYLLYALEVEQHEQQKNNDDDTREAAAAIVYSMLQAILTSILTAYDVPSLTEQAAHDKSKPLEGMSRRILSQVALQDAILCKRLQQDLQVPAQLYLTKWIRLLYSREVESETVLSFWDAIFDMMTITTDDASKTANGSSPQSSSPSPPPPPSSTTPTCLSLMAVLETIAAARLLLWRGRLHVPTVPTGQQQQQPHDDHDTLHLLMNLPMETVESTREWLNLSRQMIRYNLSRQLLLQYQQQQQQQSSSPPTSGPPPSLPIVTLPPLTAVPGVVLRATKTDSTTTSRGGSHSLASAPSAATGMTPATVFGIPARSNSKNNNSTSNNNTNNMPTWDIDRFSFSSLRQNLEETVKSTTQSIGERLHQEWENVATVRVPADQDPLGVGLGASGRSHASFPAAAVNRRAGAASAGSAYNITYRDSPLLDPPVPPARTAPAAAASLNPLVPTIANSQQQQQQQHETWARQLQIQTATLQSFMIQVEQEHERQHPGGGSRVPPLVWESLATLESLRREMISSSSSSPTATTMTTTTMTATGSMTQPRGSPPQVNNFNNNRY